MGFGRGGRGSRGDLDDGMSGGGHELDFGQDRPRRWLAFAGAGLVVVAVAVAVILAMGGSSQTADGPPPGATVGEEFNPVLENTENTAEETTAMGSTMPETTSARTTGEESGDTEEEQGEEGEEQGEGQGEDVARAGPEPGERSGDSGRNLAEEYEPGVNESLDPAGRNPDPGDLTVTDKQRVEFAVSQFVTAVYGYTGTDPDEYVNEIGRTITGDEFYDSPAGDEILEISDEVDVSGLESAAKVREFEVTDTQPGKVLGKARFDVADSYSRYGDLEGDKTYVQEITLLAEGEVYKVSAADERGERMMSTTHSATDGGRAAAREVPTGIRGAPGLVGAVLRSLNDPEAQALAYPVLDEFEAAIDLEGTDILHGWRHNPRCENADPDSPDAADCTGSTWGSCFSDPFSNAFRVMVLRRDAFACGPELSGQPVLRRVGWSGTSWLWGHTGTVTRWVVELSGAWGGKYTSLSTVEKALGKNLCFDSGAAACEGVRHMLAVGADAPGGDRGLGFRVRAVETGPDPATFLTWKEGE